MCGTACSLSKVEVKAVSGCLAGGHRFGNDAISLCVSSLKLIEDIFASANGLSLSLYIYIILSEYYIF